MGKTKTPSTDIAGGSGLNGDQSFDNMHQITSDIYQDERPNVNRDGPPIDYERSPGTANSRNPRRNGPQSILKNNQSKLN